MLKSFDCIKCGGFHPRPINRNCKEQKVQEVQGDTNTQILYELKNLSSRMATIEDKVQEMDDRRSPAKSTATGSTAGRTDDLDEDLVLPSITNLQASNRIQAEVDSRIKKLQKITEKGKCKSQRGGSETVFVKQQVPWTQNCILGGSNKSRVSYDSLSISQWVSGFATIIHDEKNLQTKQNMLECLAELMEDSHDFGWSAAKGAHAVLLCKMEEGRVNWGDTHKIDRIRRAHAQKVQNFSSQKRMQSKDNPTPCRYFQKSTCSHKTDHETNGHTYLHVCSNCFATGKKYPHASKDCRKNTKNE